MQDFLPGDSPRAWLPPTGGQPLSGWWERRRRNRSVNRQQFRRTSVGPFSWAEVGQFPWAPRQLVAILGGYLARRKDPPAGHQL